jgi:hypothetical protein
MAKRLEHGIQIGVIRWKELQKNQHPPLNNLFAIPNGGNTKDAAIFCKQNHPGFDSLAAPQTKGEQWK